MCPRRGVQVTDRQKDTYTHSPALVVVVERCGAGCANQDYRSLYNQTDTERGKEEGEMERVSASKGRQRIRQGGNVVAGLLVRTTRSETK